MGTGRKKWLATLLAWGLGAALAAQAPGAQFDSFSVKPASSAQPSGFYGPAVDPVRYVATRITLRSLILAAYDLKDYQLEGGPGWIKSDEFSVEGTTATSTDKARMMLMLRQALRERFALVLEQGTREGNVYAMTVGSGGTSLGKQDLSKFPALPALPPDLAHTVIRFQLSRRVTSDSGATSETRVYMMRGAGTSTAELAEAVSGSLLAPVSDDTGLTGTYDLGLEYAADSGPADPDAPYITTALKEQLGLILKRGHGSYTVFTVKQVEHPAANQ